MRMLRFGKFITRVPPMNLARHYDYPTSASTAVRVAPDSSPMGSGGKVILPSQRLFGLMIPASDYDASGQNCYHTPSILDDISEVSAEHLKPRHMNSILGNQKDVNEDDILQLLGLLSFSKI